MFNNRMLAVAAVLALAIPALGAAAPIVAPPQPEQLVEGHTVFTVIEIQRNVTENRTQFHAAVAVLVREYFAIKENVRFPGVLWFNDQYLVNPTAQNENQNAFRYPCGGAVMAVNAGDPDPRVSIASPGVIAPAGRYGTYAPGTATVHQPAGDPEDDSWVDTTDDERDTVGPEQAPANTDAGGLAGNDAYNAAQEADSLVFGRPTVAPIVQPHVVTDYVESYLITDPNDHVWVVDKYTTYTELGLGGERTAYASTVWVVNILGNPVFIPDDGFLSCGPYNDLVTDVYDQYVDYYTSAGLYDQTKAADNAIRNGYDPTIGSVAPYRDTPPAGYDDPGRNGICYAGGPVCNTRLYNALLYFDLADLTQAGADRDHSDPAVGDTNGCHEPAVVGGSWTCPGNDDDREGNSHAFHPSTHTTPSDLENEICPAESGPVPGTGPDGNSYVNATVEARGERVSGCSPVHAEVCPPGFDGTANANAVGLNRANHGSGVQYWTDENGAQHAYYPCSFIHQTRNIDVYFSPNGRPLAPLVRNFAVLDIQGSGAPFQDYHCSYEGATCSGDYPEPMLTDDSDYGARGSFYDGTGTPAPNASGGGDI